MATPLENGKPVTDKEPIAPNQILLTKQKEAQGDTPFIQDSEASLEPVASYSNANVLTSVGNLFRSFASPVTNENSRSVGGINSTSDEKQGSNTGQLISFYFYHSILTIAFLLLSIYRLYEFTFNRIKLRFFNIAYNPSKTPSLINSDINKLPKIPHRISVILNYLSEQEEGGGVEGICNSSADIVAWTLSSDIPYLNIYEYHGVLKKSIPELRRAIYRKLVVYFGTNNVPTFKIRIPHLNMTYYGAYDGEYDEGVTKCDIDISLLSNIDGRSTIVELTRVIADMNKSGDLSEKDITMTFIDQELEQLVGIEPDLVILFQPFLNLQGYPPWHLRLSEMYWEPDNSEVTYAVYLRALQKFSTCKVNVGR